MNIKTLSTTEFRKNISNVISLIEEKGESFVIGRRDNPEAVVIPFPKKFNPHLSEIANINSYSHSFDFLNKEPNIYSIRDIKRRRYV